MKVRTYAFDLRHWYLDRDNFAERSARVSRTRLPFACNEGEQLHETLMKDTSVKQLTKVYNSLISSRMTADRFACMRFGIFKIVT